MFGPSNSNSITLQFTSNFVSGVLSVAGNNDCGPGYSRSVTLYGNPGTPTAISGSTSVCFGNVELYSWPPVSGATQYQIAAPVGSTILSGTVTTNTFVLIQWGLSGGNIGVKAANVCGVSGTRTLNVAISCRTAAEVAVSDQLIVDAYPNPNHGQFTVSIQSRLDEKYSISLMDQTGRVLKVTELTGTSGLTTQDFDLEGIAAGMYFIRVVNADKVAINKSIIIQ